MDSSLQLALGVALLTAASAGVGLALVAAASYGWARFRTYCRREARRLAAERTDEPTAAAVGD